MFISTYPDTFIYSVHAHTHIQMLRDFFRSALPSEDSAVVAERNRILHSLSSATELLALRAAQCKKQSRIQSILRTTDHVDAIADRFDVPAHLVEKRNNELKFLLERARAKTDRELQCILFIQCRVLVWLYKPKGPMCRRGIRECGLVMSTPTPTPNVLSDADTAS